MKQLSILDTLKKEKSLISKEIKEKVDGLLKEVVIQIQEEKTDIKVFVPYGYTSQSCYKKVLETFVEELQKQLGLKEKDIILTDGDEIYKEIRAEVYEEPMPYEKHSELRADIFEVYSDIFEKYGCLGTLIEFTYEVQI